MNDLMKDVYDTLSGKNAVNELLNNAFNLTNSQTENDAEEFVQKVEKELQKNKTK